MKETIIYNPKDSLSEEEQQGFVKKAQKLVCQTFGKEMSETELISPIFGRHGGGKYLAFLEDKELEALISGQFIEEDTFHVSSAHSKRALSAQFLLNTLQRKLRFTYVSGFTQNRRLVETLCKYVPTYPNPSNNNLLETKYRSLVKTMGLTLDGFVARGKVKGEFAEPTPMSTDLFIRFWQGLDLKPQEGDLLFLVAKYDSGN